MPSGRNVYPLLVPPVLETVVGERRARPSGGRRQRPPVLRTACLVLLRRMASVLLLLFSIIVIRVVRADVPHQAFHPVTSLAAFPGFAFLFLLLFPLLWATWHCQGAGVDILSVVGRSN